MYNEDERYFFATVSGREEINMEDRKKIGEVLNDNAEVIATNDTVPKEIKAQAKSSRACGILSIVFACIGILILAGLSYAVLTSGVESARAWLEKTIKAENAQLVAAGYEELLGAGIIEYLKVGFVALSACTVARFALTVLSDGMVVWLICLVGIGALCLILGFFSRENATAVISEYPDSDAAKSAKQGSLTSAVAMLLSVGIVVFTPVLFFAYFVF